MHCAYALIVKNIYLHKPICARNYILHHDTQKILTYYCNGLRALSRTRTEDWWMPAWRQNRSKASPRSGSCLHQVTISQSHRYVPWCAVCSGTVVCPPRPRRRHCGSGARWSLTAVVPVPDGGDRSAVNMESCPRAEKLGCRWLCWFSPSSSLHRGRKVKQM